MRLYTPLSLFKFCQKSVLLRSKTYLCVLKKLTGKKYPFYGTQFHPEYTILYVFQCMRSSVASGNRKSHDDPLVTLYPTNQPNIWPAWRQRTACCRAACSYRPYSCSKRAGVTDANAQSARLWQQFGPFFAPSSQATPA